MDKESQGTRCQDRRAGRITCSSTYYCKRGEALRGRGIGQRILAAQPHQRFVRRTEGTFVLSLRFFVTKTHAIILKQNQVKIVGVSFFVSLFHSLLHTYTLQVLGACTWAQPHIIILDEPTNYLDRDALGALSNAISGKYECYSLLLIIHSSSNTFLRFRRWSSLDHAQPGVR